MTPPAKIADVAARLVHEALASPDAEQSIRLREYAATLRGTAGTLARAEEARTAQAKAPKSKARGKQ
jgi:hypothetical protein